MSQSEPSQRRLLLSRKNMGRRRMAEFLRDTSAALGLELEPTRMLELEAADALGALASVAVHAARVVVDTGGAPVPFAWRESQVPTLEALLREIAGRLPLIRAVYLPAEASLVGGVWLAPQELLPAALTLVRDREWVEFCGPACSDGLLLEYDASGAEHGVERPYELVVWGAEWAPRAEEACAALGIARVQPNVALQLTIALRIAPAPRALLLGALAAELERQPAMEIATEMWAWLRTLADRRRAARMPPEITLRPDGFVVASPDGREFRVRWASVIRVLAYKSDHFTTDEVVVAFRQREDPELVFEVSEEWAGFRELFEPMRRELGITEDWYLETIGRPFATDFRVIFERTPRVVGSGEAAG